MKKMIYAPSTVTLQNLSSIPDLYPLDIGNVVPVVTTQTCLQKLPTSCVRVCNCLRTTAPTNDRPRGTGWSELA